MQFYPWESSGLQYFFERVPLATCRHVFSGNFLAKKLRKEALQDNGCNTVCVKIRATPLLFHWLLGLHFLPWETHRQVLHWDWLGHNRWITKILERDRLIKTQLVHNATGTVRLSWWVSSSSSTAISWVSHALTSVYFMLINGWNLSIVWWGLVL